METLKIASDLAEVERVRGFLKESLEGLHLTENAYYIIELSLLEICINIIRYAYPEEKGEIFLKTWEEDDKIFVEIRDKGIPFDPTESEAPDIDEFLWTEVTVNFPPYQSWKKFPLKRVLPAWRHGINQGFLKKINAWAYPARQGLVMFFGKADNAAVSIDLDQSETSWVRNPA